jgi:hypothetical protein
MGRTPKYDSAALKPKILARLANGETLRGICADEEMPDHATVMGWLNADQDFSNQYARARSQGIDVLAESAIAVARDMRRDANCRRVELDAIKWFTSKLRPEKYGDSSTLQVSGPAGGAIQSEHTIRFVDPPIKPK